MKFWFHETFFKLSFKKEILYRKRRITRCGAPETYSTPPTAHTAGAIGLIFGLEVHRVNINGATLAIFEFPSRTPKNQLQMAKISTFAEISKWSISPV